MRLAGSWDVLRAPGPVATLILSGDRDVLPDLRRRLRLAGAEGAVLDRLKDLDLPAERGSGHPRGPGRVLVLDGAGEVRLDAPAPPAAPARAVWGPLPALLPLLAEACRAADPGGEVESDVLHRFVEQRGRAGRVTEGLAGVVRALREGTVDTLLLTEEQDEGRLAWFGAQGRHVSLERGELDRLGAGTVHRAPATDVLLRAACAADARLVVTTERRVVLGGEPAALLGGAGT